MSALDLRQRRIKGLFLRELARLGATGRGDRLVVAGAVLKTIQALGADSATVVISVAAANFDLEENAVLAAIHDLLRSGETRSGPVHLSVAISEALLKVGELR
jgi:hypothetical protein